MSFDNQRTRTGSIRSVVIVVSSSFMPWPRFDDFYLILLAIVNKPTYSKKRVKEEERGQAK